MFDLYAVITHMKTIVKWLLLLLNVIFFHFCFIRFHGPIVVDHLSFKKRFGVVFFVFLLFLLLF